MLKNLFGLDQFRAMRARVFVIASGCSRPIWHGPEPAHSIQLGPAPRTNGRELSPVRHVVTTWNSSSASRTALIREAGCACYQY